MTHNYLHNYHAKYAEFRSVFSSSLMSLVVWCTRKTRPFIFSKMLQQMPSYIFTLFFYQFHSFKASVFALFGCSWLQSDKRILSQIWYSCLLVFAPFEPGRSNHDCHQISAWVSLTFGRFCKRVFAWHMAWAKTPEFKKSKTLLGPNERHGKIEAAYKNFLFYFCGHS